MLKQTREGSSTKIQRSSIGSKTRRNGFVRVPNSESHFLKEASSSWVIILHIEHPTENFLQVIFPFFPVFSNILVNIVLFLLSSTFARLCIKKRENYLLRIPQQVRLHFPNISSKDFVYLRNFSNQISQCKTKDNANRAYDCKFQQQRKLKALKAKGQKDKNWRLNYVGSE